ncbi:MAG: hypothetical protein RML32_02430 [Gammaproteobacteria bacterium]|nr:hypothetical protein [Gammaproteobacteria bacterium]
MRATSGSLREVYEQLNFDLTLRTRESIARVRELARETHRRCPQLGLFRAARVPMLVTWYRQGSKRPLFVERFNLRAGRTPEDRLIAAARRLARRGRKR